MIAALYAGNNFHPDLLAALDDDRDGRLAGVELRLDTPERAEAVRQRLQDSGLSAVRLESEITPFSILEINSSTSFLGVINPDRSTQFPSPLLVFGFR